MDKYKMLGIAVTANEALWLFAIYPRQVKWNNLLSKRSVFNLIVFSHLITWPFGIQSNCPFAHPRR